MNWIQRLFNFKTRKQLQKEIEQLKVKLDERQEAINKTNAYWKKKMHEVNRKKSTIHPL